MRKSVMLGAVFLVALVTLTGCGGKKLTCTMTEDKNTSKAVIEFKKDEVSFMKVEEVTELDTEEEAEQAKQLMDAMSGLAGDDSGMKIETKRNGKKVTMIMSVDYSKLSEEEKKDSLNEEFDDADLTYDGIKKKLEEQGFSCK